MHVVSVVLWIGGVAFVTTVLLPADAMIAVWLLFTAMLFVIEPFVLHPWLLVQSKLKPKTTFSAVEWLHRILLFISLVSLGAVMGSHGLLPF